MTDTKDIVQRLPNDIGGLPGSPIDRLDHEFVPWEKRCHALADVLDFHKIINTEEKRKGVEALGAEMVGKLAYYERWIVAFANILFQKGILTPTEQQRQIYKATVLGRIYGLGVASLARNLGISKAQAQRIINQMDARYPVLDAWLQRVTVKAAHIVPIVCTLGWSLTSSGRPGESRTFLNYPMQGNGSELMRLVIVRAGAAGLQVAPEVRPPIFSP